MMHCRNVATHVSYPQCRNGVLMNYGFDVKRFVYLVKQFINLTHYFINAHNYSID